MDGDYEATGAVKQTAMATTPPTGARDCGDQGTSVGDVSGLDSVLGGSSTVVVMVVVVNRSRRVL